MKPTIELSIRLMDYWTDQHGQRRDKWHANLKGELGIWSCGHDPEEAVNNVIDVHNDLFPGGRREVEVTYLGRLAR